MVEKNRVDQLVGYKKATSEQLKTELAEARTGKKEAELLTTIAKAQHDTTCDMLKLVESQLTNQGKVVDRLLINGMSQVKANPDDLMQGEFTSPSFFLDFHKSLIPCEYVLMVVGSISKSTLWQTQENVPGNHFSVPFRELQLPPHSDPAAIQAKCKNLLSITYPKEPPMYEPFTEFLEDYFSDTDFLVVNTSQCYYLDGLAPDIMISIPGVAAVTAR